MDLALEYEGRMPILNDVAKEIKNLLEEILRDLPRIDKISSRVKDVDRFIEKASRKTSKGKMKYKYPLDEIQDQIGARVVVFYKSDVEPVAKRVLAEFNEIEDRVVEKEDPETFSYEARHFIFLIPPDLLEHHKAPIEFFELQISTLFQHAWAEANHDLNYKSPIDLERDQKRRIAWAAAQAWGADLIFDELWDQLKNN